MGVPVVPPNKPVIPDQCHRQSMGCPNRSAVKPLLQLAGISGAKLLQRKAQAAFLRYAPN